MSATGCSECGRRSWFLFRVWRAGGGICAACCNAETAEVEARLRDAALSTPPDALIRATVHAEATIRRGPECYTCGLPVEGWDFSREGDKEPSHGASECPTVSPMMARMLAAIAAPGEDVRELTATEAREARALIDGPAVQS